MNNKIKEKNNTVFRLKTEGGKKQHAEEKNSLDLTEERSYKWRVSTHMRPHQRKG